MSLRVRPFVITLFVALSLVMSGQIAAQAKGASPATGHMVLCTGSGAVVVFTDADGRPTAQPHICPDCVLSALSAVPIISATLEPHRFGLASPGIPANGKVPVRDHLKQAHARSPPLFV